MKNLFSSFMAIACVLFVGVSCTPENGGNNPIPNPEITVTGVPESNLAVEGGEFL